MSWVSEFTEQERSRYDALHTIPREEWSKDDLELYIAFEAAKRSADAEVQAAREARQAALMAEVEASRISAEAAQAASKALHDRAVSRWEKIRGLDG